MGGAVAAIEAGLDPGRDRRVAYRIKQGVESGERVVIGVNKFVEDEDEESVEIQTIDEAEVAAQIERVRELRASRDQAAVDEALRPCARPPAGDGNLLHPMRDALKARATLGEVSDVLRGVFGEYHAVALCRTLHRGPEGAFPKGVRPRFTPDT